MSGFPPVADDRSVASRIGTGLARLVRLGMRAAAARSDGLDRASFMLLHTLVCDGPARVSALAVAVHSDTSTVSRQTAHLVDLGLMERRIDPDDGRASRLAITDTGAAVLDNARRHRDEQIETIIESWPPTERAQFADLIERFVAGYETNWYDRPDHSRR